tara:strand:- start:46938 stop:47468 length:531 start_codon:yes stop_codon:yes gene_type:complete
MCSAKVVSIVPRLEAQQEKQRLSELLARELDDSGWTLAGSVEAGDSEVCVYLLDSETDAALVFGSQRSEFPISSLLDWPDLIQAWEVVADPELAFDDEHLRVTTVLAQQAISHAGLLPELSAVGDGQRVHLIVVLDRDDWTKPAFSLVAVSSAPVLDAVSVKSVLLGWINDSNNMQ